jgi:hypothetical protein
MPIGKETLPGGYPTINATASPTERIAGVSKMPNLEPPGSSVPATYMAQIRRKYAVKVAQIASYGHW